MQQLCLTAPILPLVFAIPGVETVHLSQIQRAAGFRAETVELEDERSFVSAETSFGVERCLEKGLSTVYGGREPPV